MSDLQRFNDFLANIDIAKYRALYAHIKTVELDLDRNIQAINHLYREYWDNRTTFPDYTEFYEIYSDELRQKIDAFREAKMFSKETFDLGLPARIYRTWASLLTQIQGGYVAEEIYGADNVRMSAELDYRGIDIQIDNGGECLKIQIKKETASREVRIPRPGIHRGANIINVLYEVPGCDPLTRTGKKCVPFARWQENWQGKLRRLDNGFIIFDRGMFLREYLLNITV